MTAARKIAVTFPKDVQPHELRQYAESALQEYALIERENARLRARLAKAIRAPKPPSQCNRAKRMKDPVRPGVRFAVLQRDRHRCRYCGAGPAESKLHVDHVNPVSRGGTSDMHNLVTACERCNLGKSDKSAEIAQ